MTDAEIAAVGGIADTALQIAGNITASTFNYKHTKELAKYQNDMAISNWNMANEYNLPSNQMARLEAAGLNPNLMYGQGSPGNASAISTPSLHSPNYRSPFEGISLAQNMQQLKAMALENNERELSLTGKKQKLYESSMKNAALDLFMSDKLGHGTLYDNGGDNYHLPFGPLGQKDYTVSLKAIRNSSAYKQLEILWQQGVLNEKNISLLESRKGLTDAQEGVLSFNEQKNELLADIMKGDFSGDSLKKLFTLLVLNLLSAGSTGGLGKFF